MSGRVVIPFDIKKLVYVIKCIKKQEIELLDECLDAMEEHMETENNMDSVVNIEEELKSCRQMLLFMLKYLPKEVDREELKPSNDDGSML